MGQIVIRPHVLSDRGELCYDAPSGTTLQEIADAVWPIEAHECVVLTVNGDVIPWEYWHVTTPKDGAVVHGSLTFGKGGGKNILSSIAMIAVAIAAPYAGAALFGAGTFAATAAAVGFSMVGAMAVNAMFKPTLSGPGTSSYTDPKESNTYTITGQSNKATPYGPVLRVYGTHRVYPRLAAVPFVVTEGVEQYLYMLLDWGFGPLWVQDLRIGETPVTQYKEVQYRFDNDFKAGSYLSLYPSDVAVEQVGVELEQGVWQQRRTEADSIGIGVDVVLPRGLVYFSDQGNRQQTSIQLSMEIAVAGTNNWVPYSYYGARTSAPAVVGVLGPQWFMGRGVKVPGSGPPMYGIPEGGTSGYVSGTGSAVPQIGHQIMWPNGDISTFTNVVNVGGGTYNVTFAPLRESIVFGTDTWAYLQVAVVGSGISTITLAANSSDTISVSINLSVPTGQYDIRIRRDSPPSTNPRLFNDITFTALRSNANRPPASPSRSHCIMELKIRASAQLTNVIQELNGVATAIVPAWNGSAWAAVPTTNPAAAFLDVLRGSANRVPVPDSMIDFASLQAWAVWCDRVAQDGLPYYRFSHVIDYSTTMYKLLNSIAAAGRATLAYKDGKIGVIMDQAQTVPAQMFTPRNSWGFESTRSYNPSPHALRVAFNDAAQGYELRQFFVYAEGYDASNATVFEDIQTFGVTSHGQAWREGRYMLAQGLLRRENFTIQVDVENLACIRGDMVLVQHDVLKVGGDSSRISEVVSGTVLRQYDAIPTLSGGYTYGIRVRKADGTFTSPVTVTVTGPYEWTLASAVTGVAKDDLLTWGVYGSETAKYIVKEVTPGDDLTATVSLVEYAEAIYTSDTGPIPAYKPPQGGRPDGIVAQPPTNVRLRNRYYTIGRRPAADIILTWNPPRVGNYAKYIVNTRSDIGSVVNITATDRNEVIVRAGVDILTSPLTNHNQLYGVAAVDFVGSTSDTMWVSDTLQNPMALPDPVLHFSSNVVGESTTLTWRDPEFNLHEGNNQIVGYDIRWSPAVTATFEQATRISELVAWPSSMISVPTRNGVYMIKPFTSSGVYSATDSRTLVITEDLVRKDYYATPRFQPDWDGTFIDCAVFTDELRMVIAPDGNYPGAAYWIARVPEAFNQRLTLRVQAYMAAYGFTAGETLDSEKFTPLANAIPLGSAGSAQKYDAKLWVSATNPMASGSLDLTEARPIIQGSIDTDTVWFIVELRSFDPLVSPSVVIGGADLDFPERTESHPDFPIVEGGTRLVFNYPFVLPPTVAITLQNAQPGQYVWRGQADQYGVDMALAEGVVQAYFSDGFSNGFYKTPNLTFDGAVDILVYGPGRVTP